MRGITFNKETTKISTYCSRQAIVWDVATTMKIRTFDFVVRRGGGARGGGRPGEGERGGREEEAGRVGVRTQ